MLSHDVWVQGILMTNYYESDTRNHKEWVHLGETQSLKCEWVNEEWSPLVAGDTHH